MNVFTDLNRPLIHRPGDAPPQPATQEKERKRPYRPRPEPNVLPAVRNPWRLSPIECEVMRLTVDLLCAKEIGAKLNRSVKTIEAHHQRAKIKMDARSLMHAALIWDRHFRKAA